MFVRRGVDKFSRKRRDSGQVLQKIQRDALTLQDGAGLSSHFHHAFAGAYFGPVFWQHTNF